MVLKLLVIWLVLGVASVPIFYKDLHCEELTKHYKELSEEFKIPEYDVVTLAYLMCFILGIILVPERCLKVIIRKVKGNTNVK